MADLTPDRLQELRRIAEAATPGPWGIPGENVFRVVAPETQNQGDPYYRWAVIADADPSSVDGEQAAANACYIAAFHPPTVLAMLDEIERLRRELDTLAGVVGAVRQAEPWLRRLARVGRCSKCDGIGRISYPSTTTWRGGIGGQMVTEDVCDRCWGSGDEERKGVDLRAMEAEIERLRRERENILRLVRSEYMTAHHIVQGIRSLLDGEKGGGADE